MTLINPNDSPERREEKLVKITQSLMRRVEQVQNNSPSSYAQFERAVTLDEQVRQRTKDLEETLALLNRSNAELADAMEAEKRARADLSNALEAVKDGFALFGGDGRMVMFNSRFCKSLPDVRAGLFVGVDIDDYFDLVSRSQFLDRTASGEPQDWARWRRRQRREPYAIFNVKLIDGSIFQVSEHPTPDGGAAILQTDVTAMIGVERAERARLLDDQARLIRATLDHINQGVVIFDAQEKLAGWNRQLRDLLTLPVRDVRIGAQFRALFGSIVLGLRFLDRIDAAFVFEWVENRLERPPLTFDVALRERVLSVFAQVMPDGGFVMSFADVTTERSAAAALKESNDFLERRVVERTKDLEIALEDAERANASKSRFVAATSHDLLQPLSAAKLFLATIEAMEIGDPALEAVHRATAALESVDAILDGLLEISKLDSGCAVMRRERIDLGALLSRLDEEFQPTAAAKNLRFSIRQSDVDIVSDRAYLRRILQNLISNAIRYTVSGGVLVGVRRRGGKALIEVWDTGPGIPPNRQREIFEEFNRLDATVNASEGLGLGLSIVERAARTLGLSLLLRSRVGSGSCFSVEAPIADELTSFWPPESSPSGDANGELLVLIVAKEATRRGQLNHLLETWGVLSLDAATEDEAVSMLAETDVRPDAIVVDSVDLNIANGLPALVEAYGAIPTALITADRSPGLDRRCREQNWVMLRGATDAAELLEFLASSTLNDGGASVAKHCPRKASHRSS